MSPSNARATMPDCRPSTASAAHAPNPQQMRDLSADQARNPDHAAPHNPLSSDDIDAQIRSFFERGQV